MRLALIDDGQVATYPYSIAQLRRDNPQVSFPNDIDEIRLADFNVRRVFEVERPAPSDPITKDVVEGLPSLGGNGRWYQTWTETDVSVEEADARREEAALIGELSAAKLDAWMVQFLAMTPAEAQQYVLNNGGTLAAVRTNLGRVAYAVRFLLRRAYR